MRVAAVLAAVACVGGQLVSLEHVASGPHIACKEHGELEDVPSVAHIGEVVHREATVENGAAPTGGHGHEHCAFASHARHMSAAGGRPVSPVSTTLADLRPAPIQVPPPKQLRALYRLAPKTSPPV